MSMDFADSVATKLTALGFTQTPLDDPPRWAKRLTCGGLIDLCEAGECDEVYLKLHVADGRCANSYDISLARALVIASEVQVGWSYKQAVDHLVRHAAASW